MHIRFSRRAALATVAAGLALGPAPALAQSGPDYFNGKTLNYIVATDAGGGYDTNGRLVAEFMQKHLPGSTFVVQNMPGAGHLIGTNYIYASEPDGLTLGTFNTGLIYGQLAGDPGAKFDFAKMTWIGKVSSDPRVIVMSKESGIDSFEQLARSKETIKFAAAGRGSAATVETGMLAKAMNLPIEIIDGYGGNEDQLAMRRGEVKGVIGFRSTWEKFVAEGNGKFIAQIGGSQTDAPQLGSFAQNDEAKKVIALIESQAKIARLTAGPPGIPADRVAALVEAYGKATSDPEFIEKAKALKLPVEPLAGQPVAEAVAAAMQPPPDLVTFLKEMMKKE
jgi:tripartite-type tricarboxylate transporter receptor subunit TctC